MKKLLVLLDTDNQEHIRKFAKSFLIDGMTFCPKVIEVYTIDEENNVEKVI